MKICGGGNSDRKSIHEWEKKYHVKVLYMHPGRKNRKLDRDELINLLKDKTIQLEVDSEKEFIQELV
ncbi:hypothetical protein [Halocella sp. SP3-1]|uniref:hypothetical protein n=1 Tax=Halocella sp. SP3-1 TaxID=2382161 RepID=UPI000F75DB68|nr:hypothetical protein [Halocella sp. SP3-1]AZO95260.1 hypothetical protein D7D81_12035 [Halocella sp. SP3-1]